MGANNDPVRRLGARQDIGGANESRKHNQCISEVNIMTEKKWPSIESTIELGRVAEAFEWRRWMVEIPYLTFPHHWQVKAVPPFRTGIIRYWIRTDKTGNDRVSVYLDCYDQAGFCGEPYWEIHPIDGDCERFMMNDTKELLDGIQRALSQMEVGRNCL